MTRRLASVPEHPPRAIVYVRVSMTGDRQEIFSPEMQEQAARDYCARRGYEIVDVLTDIDRSGRSWSKRQVESAVRQVEAGEAEVIVTWRWSRFTRNLRDYVIQTARIEAAGGRLEAALEEVDPATAAGLLQRDLFAILAQWESRKIGEAWRETHDRRRRAGLQHRNYERLGYRREGRGLVPDPDTAPVIVELYRRFVAGEGSPRLADWLNETGVVQPVSGGRWRHGTVRRMMHAGFAAGLIMVDGQWQPGAHEPLIDARLWQRYLREAERRRDLPPRLLVPSTPLSGLVMCSGCGRSMRVKQWKRGTGASYVCEQRDCPRRCSVAVHRAVAAVLDWLRPLVADREATAATRAADGAAKTLARSQRARLNRQLAALEAERVGLTRDLAQGTTTAVEFQAARDLVAAEIRGVQVTLAGIEDTLDRPAPSVAQVRRLLDGWDGTDDVARNVALRQLVWKVEVAPPLVSRGVGESGRSRVRPFGVWERR